MARRKPCPRAFSRNSSWKFVAAQTYYYVKSLSQISRRIQCFRGVLGRVYMCISYLGLTDASTTLVPIVSKENGSPCNISYPIAECGFLYAVVLRRLFYIYLCNDFYSVIKILCSRTIRDIVYNLSCVSYHNLISNTWDRSRKDRFTIIFSAKKACMNTTDKHKRIRWS